MLPFYHIISYITLNGTFLKFSPFEKMETDVYLSYISTSSSCFDPGCAVLGTSQTDFSWTSII